MLDCPRLSALFRQSPMTALFGRVLPIALLVGTSLPGLAQAQNEISIPVNSPANQVGRWRAPKPSPVIGIHAAVLPTGKVLLYSYPDMMGNFQVPPPTEQSVAYVYNPKGGGFKNVSWGYDIFCSGHSFLADGSLYVTGGWEPSTCVEGGLDKSFLFNPFTEEWSEEPDLKRARYYPSNITLRDGTVAVLSGYDQNCHDVAQAELYTPGNGSKIIGGATRALKLYPQLHLLKNGKVAMVGPDSLTATFNPATGAWKNVTVTNFGRQRNFGTSVEIPGQPNKIMICGGYHESKSHPSNSCELINFAAGNNARWQYVAPMNFARAHLNPVILPDKTILMVGGGFQDDYDAPVHNPELYDPATNTWKLLPPQVYGRMYHSSAVLLPDGRVLSAGHDQHRSHHDEGGPENGDFNEIYSPPYLFRGPRPRIKTVPEEIAYKKPFVVDSPQAASIESMVLIRLSAVTHATNTTQRLLELPFSLLPDGTLRAVAPRRNVAPPGYYMLFILNGNKAPSKAKIIRLDAANNIGPL